MLELDELGDSLADRLRDAMDPLWFELSNEEHRLLDARATVTAATAPLRLPIGERLFSVPAKPKPMTKAQTLRIENWEQAAL